jgi:Ca-activated chloride channel family protein
MKMKENSKLQILLVALILKFVFGFDNVYSQNVADNQNDKESPYFILTSGDENIENFPLLSTDVNAEIAGVIADVTVTQTYKNDGSKPIEAVYVFPSSTNAALYSMQMKIGERTIVAEIKEKSEARKIYEEAKSEGKSTSLLEQLNPNIFKMNVANILPGDIIEVELKYTELLKPVNKIYDFVFPTLVAPRYDNEDSKDRNENKINYEQTSEPTYDFDINVNLNTGNPISELECISHNVDIEALAMNKAKIKLKDSDKNKGNKDFIIKYKLAGEKIDTGLLISENGDENFFTLIVQPPSRPTNADIPPREYIFVMDVSGSMQGTPLTISKKLMLNLLKGLRQNDKFNVIQFSGNSNILSDESLPVNQKNIESAIKTISETTGGGGTEIMQALKIIDDIPKEENVSRSVVIVTDGFVRVEREVFDFISERLNQMNVFAFGIGRNVNRYIIEGIAETGQGEPAIITNFDEADYEAERFRNYISTPVMTNIQIEYKGFLAIDTEPETIPDVFADRPITIFGKWENRPTGNIKLEGFSGNEKLYLDIDVEKFAVRINSDALKYFYARNKLKKLSDYESIEGKGANKEEITEIGLKYNLLTDYTSFVAVDSEIRTEDTATTVEQVLPYETDQIRSMKLGNFAPNSSQSGMGMAKRSSYQSSGIDMAVFASDIEFEENDNYGNNYFTDNREKIANYFNCTDKKDILNETLVTYEIEISEKNEIKKLDIVSSTHPECNQEAKNAILEFIQNNEDDIPAGTFQFYFTFENPDKIEINLKQD